ncbi:MAG: restriction endonuclease [Verrucomicrobia bacterium]|nr:MAG: restriction endonuclease [Verrucomicrobiota bacterium]
MKIAGMYSFNGGEKVVRAKYPELLEEITRCIGAIDASKCKTKKSKEKTMRGKMLYAPKKLNKQFKLLLHPQGWNSVRVACDYSVAFYSDGYQARKLQKGAFREMDFVKRKLGVEVQFGKYSFMVYNVAAKMTIFKNLSFIDAGIEIVPVKSLAEEMSSGVSCFEQFVWDLEKRGVSNIDIPVLILGIDV